MHALVGGGSSTPPEGQVVKFIMIACTVIHVLFIVYTWYLQFAPEHYDTEAHLL